MAVSIANPGEFNRSVMLIYVHSDEMFGRPEMIESSLRFEKLSEINRSENRRLYG